VTRGSVAWGDPRPRWPGPRWPGSPRKACRAEVLHLKAHRARRVQVLMPPVVVPAEGSAGDLVPGHDVIERSRQRADVEVAAQPQPVGDRVPLAERPRGLAVVQGAQELLVQRQCCPARLRALLRAPSAVSPRPAHPRTSLLSPARRRAALWLAV